MKRSCLSLIALAMLAACTPADPEAEREAKYRKDFDTAITAARASLPVFWKHHQAPATDEYDFLVRVGRLPATDGKPGEERIWIDTVARQDTHLTGFFSTTPMRLGKKKQGDTVSFDEGQIIDWAFMQGDRLRGHFTTRAELPRMEADRAEMLRSVLAATPTPP